jgi:hypothetical protein
MKAWIENQMQNGFPDLKGLSINARIPIRDRLVNALLAEALQGATDGENEPRTAGPDVRSFLRFIEKAEVKASDGVIVLDLVVKV